MLFRKDIPRACEYCARGARLDDDTILCAKKGLVKIDGSCRKFKYDPCKRVPPKAKSMVFSNYEEEDFSL